MRVQTTWKGWLRYHVESHCGAWDSFPSWVRLWATHGLLTGEHSVPWVSLPGPTRMLLSPG